MVSFSCNSWSNNIWTIVELPLDGNTESTPQLKPLSYEVPIERISKNNPFWSEYVREAGEFVSAIHFLAV